MRRLLTLLLCLTMLIPSFHAMAEEPEQRLVIAITSEESALNLPLEEAFFKANPGVTIEYRLYSSNQLNSLLMTNQTDFDMIITEYAGLIDMAEKDYLLTLDQIGLEAYPAELLDMSELLMYNEKLFALPISIGQEAWFIHYELSEQNNIEYPAKDGAWTWEEYLEFSKRFPILFGKNREKNLYMMTGASLLDYPALQNVQVDMFLNYLALYPNEINRFFTDYFPTFRQVLKSDALMPRKLDESGILRENRTNDVLMVITSADNPIGMMQSFMAREGYLDTLALMHDPNLTFSGGPTEEEIVNEILPSLDSWMLLPVPVFDKNDVRYLGYMTACGIMKNAPHKELAAKFIEAMYSEEALDMGVVMGETAFIGRECPSQLILDKYAYYPVFMDENGTQVYTWRQDGRLSIFRLRRCTRSICITKRRSTVRTLPSPASMRSGISTMPSGATCKSGISVTSATRSFRSP
ncbi:MAG: extracellular solute-binding protein [Christensenellaceae bacterium]|nr:extracellular solute-binding protein [Christensenellaceae bacterium]